MLLEVASMKIVKERGDEFFVVKASATIESDD